MTVVHLTALETLLGERGPVGSGRVVVEYWAGRRPYVNVDGGEVTFPAEIRVAIADGAPVVPIDLVPTGGLCCVRWSIKVNDPFRRFEAFTTIPDTGPVDFGDLPVVDPVSFAPVDPTPTLVQTIDARIAEVGVPEEEIEQAVSDYLGDNPPSAGTIHTQTIPSASWVISHSFGRVPNVAIYIGGELVDTDVAATTSTVTITFPTPAAGVAVLN